MRGSFADLEKLLASEPEAYRREIERLRVDDPERFEAFVTHVQKRLGPATKEDPPSTNADVESLIGDITARLGWPRVRVLAEALLRLDLVSQGEDFRPLTPVPRRERPHMRRRSSISALVVGQPKTRRAPR